MRDIKKMEPENIERGAGLKITEKTRNVTKNSVEHNKKCC
jgi:hypothetical protein